MTTAAIRVRLGHAVGLAAALAVFIAILSPPAADAQLTEQVLYNFCLQGGSNCTDGGFPSSGLTMDGSGNLYGTTSSYGGANNNGGTVFKLTPSGSGYAYTVLYSFCAQGSGNNCLDGNEPSGGLSVDGSGNLYGTTLTGGQHNFGTVFKLTPSGSGYTYTVLYSFCAQGVGANCTDGGFPSAGLIMDASGDLYGTTSSYGQNGNGTVFKLTPSGSGYAYTVLYGAGSNAGLIIDGSGSLYGTTGSGGTDYSGTVFKLAPSGPNYTYTVLYNFCSQGGSNCTDGGASFAGLTLDGSGNLYGTTSLHGQNGSGTVFKLTPSGPNYAYTVLYSFCSQGGNSCTDGGSSYAGLTLDRSGNLYGTTLSGGAAGGGTVFKLAPSGSGYTYTVLYSFCSQGGSNNCLDGNEPSGGLSVDGSGNLYGTTTLGGISAKICREADGPPTNCGTVFELANLGSAPTALAAAVLPASRSVETGANATAFATIINAGSSNASSCSIAPQSGVPASFVYQTTNPTNNALTGTANTPVDIARGASQSFVIAFTPSAAFAPTDVAFNFACANAPLASVIPGVNTLEFTASASPVPDIVALAASGDPGYVDIAGASGSGDFAVATVNLGTAAQITASANTGTATLPISLSLCQTDPQTGVCLAAPATSVTATIAANGTPTFGIFVAGNGSVADSPGTNRVFVEFTDAGGTLHGETSVAVRTR